MRLTRVPLYLLGDHVVNLKLLLNAYVETNDEDYDTNRKYGIRYYMDAAGNVENFFVRFKTKKQAHEALFALTHAAETMMIEEDE